MEEVLVVLWEQEKELLDWGGLGAHGEENKKGHRSMDESVF